MTDRPVVEQRFAPLRSSPMTICVLCGVNVLWGRMLGHKRIAHGEALPPGKPAKKIGDARIKAPKKKGKRHSHARILSGGLPSLGKRR